MWLSENIINPNTEKDKVEQLIDKIYIKNYHITSKSKAEILQWTSNSVDVVFRVSSSLQGK